MERMPETEDPVRRIQGTDLLRERHLAPRERGHQAEPSAALLRPLDAATTQELADRAPPVEVVTHQTCERAQHAGASGHRNGAQEVHEVPRVETRGVDELAQDLTPL